MKKKSLLIAFLSAAIIGLGQNPPSCTDSTILNTGYNHNTNAVFTTSIPGLPVIDPYWIVTGMPTSSYCQSVNVPSPAFVVSDLASLSEAEAIAYQATSELNCNNPSPNAPIVFERKFCLAQNDEVIISGLILFDDAVCITIDNSITIPISYFASCGNPGDCNSPCGSNISRLYTSTVNQIINLNAGTHTIQLKLRNTGGGLCSVKFKGSIKSSTGKQGIFLCPSNCDNSENNANSVLVIRKIRDKDRNCNGIIEQIELADMPLPNWVFTITTPLGTTNHITDLNCYIYLSGLPSSGTVNVTETMVQGYTFISTSLGAVTSPGTFSFPLDGSPLYNIVVINKKCNPPTSPCICNPAEIKFNGNIAIINSTTLAKTNIYNCGNGPSTFIPINQKYDFPMLIESPNLPEDCSMLDSVVLKTGNMVFISAIVDKVNYLPLTYFFYIAGSYCVEHYLKINGQVCNSCKYCFTVGPCSDLLFINTTTINATCNANNGVINIVAYGPPPLSYSIDGLNFQTSPVFSGLAAGNYTVILKDGTGCTKTKPVSVSSTATTLSLSVTATNQICTTNNGSIIAIPSGGTAPLKYSIDGINFQQLATFNGLAAGSYTITVKDANSCSKTATVVVGNFSPNMNIKATVEKVACNTTNTGKITVMAPAGSTAPYSYTWLYNGNPISPTTGIITNLTAGTYTVNFTDANGCTGTQAFTVETEVCPCTCGTWQPLSVNNTNTFNCGQTINWNCNTKFDFTTVLNCNPTSANCTPSYNWNIKFNGSAIKSGTSFGNGMSKFTPTNTGIYTLTINGSCNGTACTPCIYMISVDCTPPCNLTLSETHTNSICTANNGSINITVSGGTAPYTYAWSHGSNMEDPINLSPGSLTVTVTDANGCTATKTVNIQSTSVDITVNTLSFADEVCNNQSGSVAIAASGGTSPYTYAWKKNGLALSQTTTTLSGLSAGTYVVTVTDANGCTGTGTKIIQNTNQTITVLNATTTNVLCNTTSTGQIVFGAPPTSGTPPYTYTWTYNGTPLSTTTHYMHNIAAGIYQITIKDANGCSVVKSYAITNEPCPQSCCTGGQWISKYISWSNKIDKLPVAAAQELQKLNIPLDAEETNMTNNDKANNNAPAKPSAQLGKISIGNTGPIGPVPDKINITACNTVYHLSQNGKYTLNADYQCGAASGLNCNKVIKVTIQGPAGCTFNGTYTAPYTQTFTQDGNYTITYEAYCGTQVCGTCTFTLAIDKNCCLGGKWIKADYQLVKKNPGSMGGTNTTMPIGMPLTLTSPFPTYSANVAVNILNLNYQCAAGCPAGYKILKRNMVTGVQTTTILPAGQTSVSIRPENDKQLIRIFPLCGTQQCGPMLLFFVTCSDNNCTPPGPALPNIPVQLKEKKINK
jgi:hypothetical protein